MTVIVCAATNCVHNDGGLCSADEIKFALVDGSDIDLKCEDFEPRRDDGKTWRGDTHALEQDYDADNTESVSASSQR